MKIPNLFIVGADKSGTSAMHNLLSQHPEIFMSKEKEPSYFCKDFHKKSDNFSRNKKNFKYRKEKQYLDLFKEVKTEKIVGESSAIYLYSRKAAKEIFKFNPNSKILIMIREPVSRNYSFYNHFKAEGKEKAKTFKKAIFLEKERRNGKKIPSAVMFPEKLFYSEKIKYASQIKRFKKLFKKNLHVIIYEDFKKDNLLIYKKILQWLKVDDSFKPKIKNYNPPRKLRINSSLNYFIFNFPLKNLFRKKMGKQYSKIKFILRKILLGTGKYPPLDKNFKIYLMKKYKREVEKVSELLNKNLVKKWGYDKI